MSSFEDLPFEWKHYASPKTMPVGVADKRTGADTLLILSGTVVLPMEMARHGQDERVTRKRIRFVVPQVPKLVTSQTQIKNMQVTTAIASFYQKAGGEVSFAIDQSLIEWATDLKELRAVIDVAFQGKGSTISRVMYSAYVLAQTG
jgi:hypothetical protein